MKGKNNEKTAKKEKKKETCNFVFKIDSWKEKETKKRKKKKK